VAIKILETATRADWATPIWSSFHDAVAQR